MRSGHSLIPSCVIGAKVISGIIPSICIFLSVSLPVYLFLCFCLSVCLSLFLSRSVCVFLALIVCVLSVYHHHHIFVYSEKAGRQTASPQMFVLMSHSLSGCLCPYV